MAEILRTLEETLLAYLKAQHRGLGQAITRGQLVWAMKTMGFDIGDRQVRKALENLRASHPEGGWICSSSESAGYWWSETEEEIRAANAEDYSRIQATSAKIQNRTRLLQHLEEERVMTGRLFS
jgi:hypothetical protein